MKMKLLLYFLVVLGPLLCEEKSSIGYRLRLKVPKAGLFNFDESAKVWVIIYSLVCAVCVFHMLITCLIWRNKPNRVFRGRFNNNLMNSLRELMHNSSELKVEVIMSLRRGENLAHMRVVQGILIHLRDCKLEMLIWFILHDMMLRVDLRSHRIFCFCYKCEPVYTVQEILAGTKNEFRPLQEFILKRWENPEKSKPSAKCKGKTNKTPVKQERSKVKNVPNNVSKPKERVEDMTEMITSMFAPCVTQRKFDEDYESFLYPKIRRLTEKSTKPLCLPPGGYEQTMQRKFEEESVIYSSEMTEDVKQTVKAHYMMAGGFANDLRRMSEQKQARKEEDRESNVIQEEIETQHRRDDNVVSKTNDTAGDTQELGFVKYVNKLPVPTCSLGELQAESIFSSMEKEAEYHRQWEYKDYVGVAVGCGTLALVLISVYRFLRH